MDPLHGTGYVDEIASGVAVARMQSESMFVAMRAVPRLMVKKPSGLYHSLFEGDLNRDEMDSRGPTATAAKAGVRNKTKTFSTDAQSIEFDHNDAQAAASDIEVNPETYIPRVLGYKTLIRFERRFSAAFFVDNVWHRKVTGAASTTLTSDAVADREYFDDADQDPIEALTDEVRMLSARVGADPLTMELVLGARLWHKIRNHAKVKAQVSSSIGSGLIAMARQAELDDLTRLLGIRWCGVSRAIHNTAITTADVTTEAQTNSYIVPQDDALLVVNPLAGEVNAQPQMALSIDQPAGLYRPVWTGVTANTDGVQIRRVRNEFAGPAGSWAWILDTYNGFEVQDNRCGVRFAGMVTP